MKSDGKRARLRCTAWFSVRTSTRYKSARSVSSMTLWPRRTTIARLTRAAATTTRLRDVLGMTRMLQSGYPAVKLVNPRPHRETAQVLRTLDRGAMALSARPVGDEAQDPR